MATACNFFAAVSAEAMFASAQVSDNREKRADFSSSSGVGGVFPRASRKVTIFLMVCSDSQLRCHSLRHTLTTPTVQSEALNLMA